MRAEFTMHDKRVLREMAIAPEPALAMSREEQAALIHQLQLDLNATEAELRCYRHRAQTHDAIIQEYQRLDAECAALRRAKRSWRASACCLAAGALFWFCLARWIGARWVS